MESSKKQETDVLKQMIASGIITLFLFLNIIFHSKSAAATVIDDALNRRILGIFGPISNLETSTYSNNQINSENCVCVEHYLCNSNQINENGIGIIDIRRNDDGCESYLDVCCPPENVMTQILQPLRRSDVQSGCGWRNTDGVRFRISGASDNESCFGEFPWMVAVLKEPQLNTKVLDVYQCGGSLIHPKVVVTAAHCVKNIPETYIVRAGEWDTQTTKELLPHQDRKVSSVIIHPNFHIIKLHNDIALLILDSPFDIQDHINVLCVPPQETRIANGSECWATGWGKHQFGAEGKYQAILKKIKLPLIDSKTCENNLRTTRLGKGFELHESFVCAGGEAGKDTCEGDGGGPLICPIQGQFERYQQVGIVSWGIGCAQAGIPGVYVNVALFRNWIDGELSKYNIDTSLYKY